MKLRAPFTKGLFLKVERSAGGPESLKEAAELLARAKNPVIVSGGGVVMAESGGVESAAKLAEKLQAPVCTTYLHNDAFPKNHPLLMGPLGYQVSLSTLRYLIISHFSLDCVL